MNESRAVGRPESSWYSIAGAARFFSVVALLLALSACDPPRPEKIASVPSTGGAQASDVFEIKLSLSNVYLIRSAHPVLIDSGSPKDLGMLKDALGAIGLKLTDIGLIVLTHGHADHAGLAADLKALTGAKVALGRADAAMASTGHNDTLKPTSLMARLIRPFVDLPYTPFEPDIYVSEDFDLSPFGVQGRVMYLPGHTGGSTVTYLGNRGAFVGDMMMGGSFGGAIFPHSPGEHYYQADLEANHRNIATLIGLGVEHFYLGHGGPVERADVMRAFGSAQP